MQSPGVLLGHTVKSKAHATPPDMLHDWVMNQLCRPAPASCAEQPGQMAPSTLMVVVGAGAIFQLLCESLPCCCVTGPDRFDAALSLLCALGAAKAAAGHSNRPATRSVHSGVSQCSSMSGQTPSELLLS